MKLGSTEEKMVWALAYAAAEASTRWEERNQVDQHLLSQRADASVVQFRQRCSEQGSELEWPADSYRRDEGNGGGKNG